MRRALVVGRGIAGFSCAELLARHGWEVEVCGPIARPAPYLVLNEVTCDLLMDIWQVGNELLKGSHALKERKICWGREDTYSTVEQSSEAIKGDLLMGRLLDRLLKRNGGKVRVDGSPARVRQLADPDSLRLAIQECGWVVDASGRAAQVTKMLDMTQRRFFGQRRIISIEVRLSEVSARHTCWIETVPEGWVFLAPLGGNRAMLQAMIPGAPKDPSLAISNMLSHTRGIEAQVAQLSGTAFIFDASPQKSDLFCGPGWISVGDAAASLDPISGDGTGHAIRGAILASSVMEGIASGLPSEEGLRHYNLRLHKTFYTHLKECFRYYSAGFSSSDWKDEITLTRMACTSSEHHMAETASFAYRLDGLKLVPCCSFDALQS